MINTHTIEDGSVQLIEVHGIVGDVVAKIIGGTVSDPGLDTSTGNPHAEITRVMVPPIILAREFTLAVHSATEFATEDHERVIQQTALLQIFHQRSSGLISVHALVLDLRR